jgi:hypothetical protein
MPPINIYTIIYSLGKSLLLPGVMEDDMFGRREAGSFEK